MKKGFTLLEVVIALLIVAILATGLLPALASLTKASLNSELVYAVPGIAQTKLETDKGEESNNVYLDKFGIKMNSTSTKLNDDLEVSTVTVKTGESGYGYSYSLSTMKDLTNEWMNNENPENPATPTTSARVPQFTGSTIAQVIAATSSTSTTASTIVITPTTSTTLLQFTGSTIWTATRCQSDLDGNLTDDTAVYGDQYVEVRAGNDGIISYGLTFRVPSAINGDNYIIIAIPGNTDLDPNNQHPNKEDKEYSYVAFVNKKNGKSPGACDVNNSPNGNGNIELLPSASATREGLGNGGAFLFPKGSSTATVVYQYKLSAHVEKKAAWSLRLSIKFLDGTPTANQWVRIYIPNSSGEVTKEIPATTEDVTVTNTFYEPYTASVNQLAVDGLIAWDSITFDLSDNASVTVKVKTGSMTNPYVFHATGPATQVNIIIGYLPVDKELKIEFTVAPIDNTKSATISNVQVFYWSAATSP